MNLEKYVIETILNPIIKNDKNEKYILEEDFDHLNLSYNEKKFVIDTIKKYNITIKNDVIVKKDRPLTVKEFEYGINDASGTLDRDIPVKADIEYNEYGDLVFENYTELEEFLEKEFIPSNVTLKKKVKSTDDKLYPFIKLGSIVKLRLSELEFKHVLNYLDDNGIIVRGKDSTVDGEFENYDYYQTYKSSLLPKALLGREQEEKFELYYATKDPVIREQLIIGSMRLASYVAYKMNVIFGFDIHELESYAYEGLIEAVDRFNPNYNYKFSTYGYKYIKGYILSGILELDGINKTYWTNGFLNAKRKVENETGLSLKDNEDLIKDIVDLMVKNGTISSIVAKEFPNLIRMVYCNKSLSDIEEEIIAEEESPENIIIKEEMKEKIANALYTLSPKEKMILEYRFGFLDGKVRTLDAVAKEFNVGRERIRQIEAKALRKLRHPRRSREILPYTEKLTSYDYKSNDNNQVHKTYLDEIIEKHTGQKR